jgi:hypothetical protein
MRPYLKKTHHKKGLVEWLKVKAQVQVPVPQEKKKKLYMKTTFIIHT